MKNNKWHLDTNVGDALFRESWSTESHAYLLKLFKCLDESEGPVMSMLPSGVTPAGAAAAAAVYFLPNLKHPPSPHCRVALFPGLHFVRQLKGISFGMEDMWRAIQKARASGGSAASAGPLSPDRFSR
jgi:hypothetical protein